MTQGTPEPDPGRLEFDIVDVFGVAPFTGNQLAVVHGAEQLDDAQLLTVAREFGFSETTFPVARDRGSYDVRIFTVEHEIPFAGHPTLGTAYALHRRGAIAEERVVQHCAAGEIGVVFAGGRLALSAVPRDQPVEVPDAVAVGLLRDLGLRAEDLVGTGHVAGAGLSFVYLPVQPGSLATAHASTHPLSSYGDALGALAQDPLEGIAVYEVGGGGTAVTTRVFIPGSGTAEDAATGSAAAGLGLVLATGPLPEGGAVSISQGRELGRPSRLHLLIEARGGRASAVHVAGLVHQVASGSMAVPAA